MGTGRQMGSQPQPNTCFSKEFHPHGHEACHSWHDDDDDDDDGMMMTVHAWSLVHMS